MKRIYRKRKKSLPYTWTRYHWRPRGRLSNDGKGQANKNGPSDYPEMILDPRPPVRIEEDEDEKKESEKEGDEKLSLEIDEYFDDHKLDSELNDLDKDDLDDDSDEDNEDDDDENHIW